MSRESKVVVGLVDTINSPDLERLADEKLHGLATVRVVNGKKGKELGRELRDAQAAIVDSITRVNSEVLEEMHVCKAIVTATVGFDNIDLDAASKKGICVSNVPGYCVEEVADHTIGFLVAISRKMFLYVNVARAGRWHDWQALGAPIRIRGKTIGIIGLGRIGTAVALRAKSLGLQIIVYDPYLPTGKDRSIGVRSVDFETLLRESDIVSLHLPLNSETRHMIGTNEFSKMKKGVIIINTARGAVIDHAALIEALRSGKVAGAGLDVLETEPPSSEDPILKIESVLVTPHTGFASIESQVDRQSMAVDEVARILRRQRPLNLVNQDLLYKG